MGYATQQDLIDRFGAREITQLTDRANVPPTTIDTIVVGRALDDSTALIDGYLIGLYALPLSAVPAILVKTASDISRYFLWGEAVALDGPVAKAYTDALAWLKAAAAGTVKLEADGLPTPANTSGARVQASRPDMTRQSLRGLI